MADPAGTSTGAVRAGTPANQRLHEILNAIFYVLRSGCAWRMLPRDFPLSDSLLLLPQVAQGWNRKRSTRFFAIDSASKRDARSAPSAAILDSQTAKTTEKGGLAATM